MKKKTNRVVVIFILVFILLIGVIASLPLLLSSNGGRQFALRQINQRIPGELFVGSWSLRWLGDMTIEKLSFTDISGFRLFDLSKASIGRGLFNLIMDHNNLGEIKLVNPLVSVPATTVGKSGAGKVATPSAETGSGSSVVRNKVVDKKQKYAAGNKFTMPSIRGTVTVEDGTVQMLSSNGASQTVISDMALELTLAGDDKPISFKINAVSSTPGSMCTGIGTITMPTDTILDVDKIAVDLKLKLDDIDLKPISEIAGAFSASPILNGILNSDIALAGNLADGFKVNSKVSLNSVAMPEKKLKFGDIEIDLAGNVKKDSADIEKAFIKSGFCNINAKGSYGGSVGGVVTVDANVDMAETMQLLKELGVVTNELSCAGKLEATINGKSNGDIVAIKEADIKISDLNINYQGKNFKQERILLSTSADINIAKEEVNIQEAKLVASVGSVTLTSLHVGDWKNIPGSVKTRLKTDIDIKTTRVALSDFIELPDNWGFSGQLLADLNIDFTQPENYEINFNASIPSLKVVSMEPPLIIEDAPELSVNMTVTPKGDVINVTKASLNSKLMDVDLSANFNKLNEENRLKLKGLLAPSLTELSRYMAAYSDIPVTFAGKKPGTFDFATSWCGSGETLKILSMYGKTGLHADKIDGFGFHIRGLTVPVVFENNKAKLELKAKVNDGDLNFISSVDIGGKHPAIHLPDNLVVLRDVNITTEVADELLGLINPIFRGVSTVDGKMSFVMNNFSWPLKKEDMMDRVFAGEIIFNDVNLSANGLLTDLLDLAKVGTRELEIGDTSIDINCADGKIKSSPLDLKVKKYELILDGEVGLDNSLAYKAKVPMTETLVGKSGYKYLEGMSLDVPIGGTIDKPILNLRSFEYAVSKLVQQAATKALSGELEKQLNKLFK